MADLAPEVRDVMAGRTFAHLATVLPDGAPHSVPVWMDVRDDGRLVMFTQSGSRKARNIARDARVAVSAVDEANPYRQCDIRGRVVERIDGDAALAIADELSVKYTGDPFPWRSPATIVLVIEPDRATSVTLPFTHRS
ncbi:MAG: TIGR03618 family F420-dependent PPOX class oxidoreductase [Thermoleophilia bacterium]